VFVRASLHMRREEKPASGIYLAFFLYALTFFFYLFPFMTFL